MVSAFNGFWYYMAHKGIIRMDLIYALSVL